MRPRKQHASHEDTDDTDAPAPSSMSRAPASNARPARHPPTFQGQSILPTVRFLCPRKLLVMVALCAVVLVVNSHAAAALNASPAARLSPSAPSPTAPPTTATELAETLPTTQRAQTASRGHINEQNTALVPQSQRSQHPCHGDTVQDDRSISGSTGGGSGRHRRSAGGDASVEVARPPRRSLLESGEGCCSKLSSESLSFSSNLPVLIIDTGGAAFTSKEDAVMAAVCSCSPEGGKWDDVPYTDIDAEAQIKIRGSSSVSNKKKSYNLKFRARKDDGGTSKLMVPMLGMPADDQWALYGPETDKTLGMRNVLAYSIFRRMGRWAPRTRYCEVFIVDDSASNAGPQHYGGLFIMTERITIGPNRVNVRRMDPDKDLSGGYIFGYENDNIDARDLTFRPATTLLTYVMHEPDFNDQLLQGGQRQGGAGQPSPRETAALKWISAYVNQMESALLADFPATASIRAKAGRLPQQGLHTGFPNGRNGPTVAGTVGAPDGPLAATGGGWQQFVEFGSFIDYFLATEVYKNPDGYRGSIYMSKNAGSPIVFGPPWDYNEAFGVCCGYPIEGFDRKGVSSGSSGGSAITPEGWRFNICDQPERCKADPIDGISQYYRAAWRNASVRTSASQRWQQLRAGALSDAVLDGMVSALANLLGDAAMRNYDRWKAVYDTPYFKSHMDQWKYEVQQLSTWLLARVRWMDGALAGAARGVSSGQAPASTQAQSLPRSTPARAPAGTAGGLTNGAVAAAATRSTRNFLGLFRGTR